MTRIAGVVAASIDRMVIVGSNAEANPGLTVTKISDEAGAEVTNAAFRLVKRVVADQEAVRRY